MTLDRYRPGVGQQIADVLQLPGLLDEPRATASPAMVRLAVRRACAALAGSDWGTLWNRKRTALHAAALAGGLLVPAVFAWCAPQAARLSLARWLLGSSERWPQETYLTVMGLDAHGRLLAPRDERFMLEVRTDLPLLEPAGDRWVVQGRGEPLVLRSKPERPQDARGGPRPRDDRRTDRPRRDDGRGRRGAVPLRVPAVARLVDLRADRRRRLARAARPGARRPARRWPRRGSASRSRGELPGIPERRRPAPAPALPARHRGRADAGRQRAARGRPVEGPSRQLRRSSKRIDERTFAAHWTLREATTLEILLTSAQTGLTSKPTFLSIGLLKDREPRVTLRAVGVGGHVTPVATIPLTIAATDDFGLAALRLRVERTMNVEEKEKIEPRTQATTVALPLAADPARPVLDHQARHDVDLQADPPTVGTVLRFMAEADDRCARGAQTGRSSVLALQVVSPDELFYEILIRQRAERAKFLAVLETMEKQTPVLAGKPSTDDFLRVMRVQHAASRQLDQIAGRIADTLQEMKLNQVGSPKSHRLLQEGVIDPIRALDRRPDERVAQRPPGARRRRLEPRRESRGGSTPARRSRDKDERHPRTDVAVGKLRRRREPGRRSHQDAAEGSQGHRESPGIAYAGGLR